MKIKHYSKSVVGSVRLANEDCVDSIINNPNPYSNLFVVCDGMGGYVGGAKASEIATKNIIEYFSREPDSVPQNALRAALEFANIQIYGTAQVNPELKGMGTTCTVLVENGGLVYIAHVGDSRIYISTDKKLYRLTKDHSYVQSLVDAGQITDAQMETHPRKNELTKALGISEDVKVEVASQPIFAKKGDKFLLCTDGLCGLITDKLILSTINSGIELEETVNELISLAERAGGHDNISVDLIEIIQSEHTNTKFENKNNETFNSLGTQELKSVPKTNMKSTNKILILILLLVLFLGLSTGVFITMNQKKEIDIPKKPRVIVDVSLEDEKEENSITKTNTVTGSKFPKPSESDKDIINRIIKKIEKRGRVPNKESQGCKIVFIPKNKMEPALKDTTYKVKVKVSLNKEIGETSFKETILANPKLKNIKVTAKATLTGQPRKKENLAPINDSLPILKKKVTSNNKQPK